MLNFAKAFLRYLTKMRLDTRYKEFDLFLEMPKTVKESKRITQRIVTIEDTKNVLSTIDEANKTLSLLRDSAKTTRPLCCSVHTQGNVLTPPSANSRSGSFVALYSATLPCLTCWLNRTKLGCNTMYRYTLAL
jgi:hypothetical protein